MAAAPLVYMVCDPSAIDASTNTCTQPQWVQAPQLIPPLDITGGIAISIAVLGVWALAAVYKTLSK